MPDTTPSAQRRRFRPRLWAALLTAVFVVITVRLGNWQGDRAGWRLAQHAQLQAATAAPPLMTEELPLAVSDADALRYRRINVRGRFLPDQQYLLDNRVQDGHAGLAVLQVFALEAAQTDRPTDSPERSGYVLVDRGWIAAPANRAQLPIMDAPPGVVTIDGRLNQPMSRNPGTADNAPGRLLNYVHLGELSRQTGVALRPWLLEQTAGPGFVGGSRPAPGANHEKNLIYQMQWYAFAGLAVVLFVVLSFRPHTAPREAGAHTKESN
ncbi:MAG: SURF1 family protein [Burkholderiales bacterium]|nr:SURF1 family protein [Burkholderiales bacterium]